MNLKKFIIFINSENADMSNVKLRMLRSRCIIQGFLRMGKPRKLNRSLKFNDSKY